MKTPFTALKETGAPDAVATFLAALLLVVCLTPWLDISLGGVTLKDEIPWYMSPIAGFIFILLFVPCIPAKSAVSPAENELIHRFYWIREHLLVDDLTVDSAQEAHNALNGEGGEFRVAEAQYAQTHIEPILRRVNKFRDLHDRAAQLRTLCRQLPEAWGPEEKVDPNLAAKLKSLAGILPLANSA
jgi:hypothetical protein